MGIIIQIELNCPSFLFLFLLGGAGVHMFADMK